MRKLLNTVWRVVTAPIRLITWPYRALRDFINYEPDDTATTEVFARAFQQPSVLVDHLEALRRHLFRSVAAMAITTAISLAFASRILDLLATPIGGLEGLQAIEVTESIGAFMRVSLLSGFALALPYISFEMFAFINPGLKRNERILVLFSLPVAFLLFLSGIAFTYFVLLEPALDFLLGFMGVTTVPRPSNYIRFVTNLMFWIGLAFEFPLVIYVLAGIGVVDARTLARGWRFAIVGIAVLAAAATPTVDPVNMALVMAPMIFLYFFSILLAAIAGAGRRRQRARAEAQPSSSPTQ
jgi:sec-independent protein translocase protein TatC